MAVIALCAVATVATVGACGVAAVAAAGALKGALLGSAIGAAGGAFKGALSYMEENDTLDGSGSYILEEAAKGFSSGAISGAASGAMAGAAKYAKNPSGYCFVSGTLVLTLAGLIAIENIKPGDVVYAKEATGIEQSVDTDSEATLNPVLEIYEREVYETYRLTIDGEEIETTANHPFYTEDGEAVEAKDLKEGDKLSTADSESATVEQTEKVVHDEPVKVYNFVVMDYHTYYVGEVGVLVHNECNGSAKSDFEKWLNKGENNNKVYHAVDNDGREVYTGITKQSEAARLAQHQRAGKPFVKLEPKYDGLTRNQARAIEQYFIKKGPNKFNKINSISKKNKHYGEAVKWDENYINGGN